MTHHSLAVLGSAAWCIAAMSAMSAPAWAQASTQEVAQDPEIVVTAPTPLRDAGAGRTAGAADLEAAHAADLTDYLKRMTGGVFVNDVQNNPLQPDISYRGFTASPLLGTPQGLSVYVDGVRVNQPFGDVVSWDLIPTSAIRSIDLLPGSNPLFGRNSLGGALAIRTKNGVSDPGYAIEARRGSFDRRTLSAQAGGHADTGLNWFLSGDGFAEDGWRDRSPSKAGRAFAKLGWSDAASHVALSGSFARTTLNGNGLQEQRLLARDRSSVYSYPDTTRNRALLVNLTGDHRFSDALSVSGNAFYRRIRTRTFNGDVNDDALGENLYQPTAAERAALTAAGYAGFPVSGETQANTPFPKWRCISNILLNSEPNEKCDALANRSASRQREYGGTIEATLKTPLPRGANILTIGFSYVAARSLFEQSSQFGYLTPDHGIVTIDDPGAFADGSQASENAFDARVNLVGRTSTASAYALDGIDLGRQLHVDLSARYDRTVIHDRDRITPGGGTGSLDGDDVYRRLNPAVAVRWTPTRRFALDAAIAQTSRAPSAIEIGCADPASPCRLPNALAGDPPLRQVVARTIEGGVHANLHGVAIHVDAFRTVSRDDILFVADDRAGFGYFRNFGRTRREGVDLDLSADAGPVHLTAHYTLLHATYRSAETVDGSANSGNDGVAAGFDGTIAITRGDRIPLIPRQVFKTAATWKVAEALSLTADMIAVSGVYARGNENNAHRPDGVYYLGAGKTDGYAVANLGAEVRPITQLTLFVQVNNLFATHYATAAQLGRTGFDANGNFVARPFAGPVIDGERPLLSSTFYAPGAPRTAQLGARLRF